MYNPITSLLTVQVHSCSRTIDQEEINLLAGHVYRFSDSKDESIPSQEKRKTKQNNDDKKMLLSVGLVKKNR